MIKRIFAILLATIMICSISPMNAFANQTSGSIAVSYTYSPEYSINIPASISINDGDKFIFSANTMDIGSNKNVRITIDGAATYENGGNFYLCKDKGTENEQRISCRILRGLPSSSSFEDITGLSELVATFTDGNTSSKAYGALKFKPQITSSTPYGTYTGTVYSKRADFIPPFYFLRLNLIRLFENLTNTRHCFLDDRILKWSWSHSIGSLFEIWSILYFSSNCWFYCYGLAYSLGCRLRSPTHTQVSGSHCRRLSWC